MALENLFLVHRPVSNAVGHFGRNESFLSSLYSIAPKPAGRRQHQMCMAYAYHKTVHYELFLQTSRCPKLCFSSTVTTPRRLLSSSVLSARGRSGDYIPEFVNTGLSRFHKSQCNGLRQRVGTAAMRAEAESTMASEFPAIVNGDGLSVNNGALCTDLEETTASYVIKKGLLLAVKSGSQDGVFLVEITLPENGMILHWGVDNWKLPDSTWWPSGTVAVNESKAIETPFLLARHGQWQVVIRICNHEAPRRLVFVLRDKEGNWYNNGSHFSVDLKSMDLKDLVDQVVVPETTYSNWSLFSRFILASELLDSAEAVGAAGMALIYTWLRFSANRQLVWYRNCNYQSKDIAHVQERLATSMAQKVRGGKDPLIRRFARLALATIPRGGGDSEQIRMGILNIMREHGIKEGHRPGLEELFLEQWHQKLHTNTSPEDIHICEAYLDFLHTNSMDNFYRTLWYNGHITKEALETMNHPITARPRHLPHLIPAFQHFLWVLKTVHSGADVDVAMEMSKGLLDDDLKAMIYHICSNRDAWWIPGKVVEARRRLENVWRAEWASRDVVLLDIALDGFFGLCLARIDKTALSGDDLCELIALAMENACIASESEELNMCFVYWLKVKGQARWTQEWALLAMAAIDRISLALQGYMDEIYGLVQPHGDALGRLCGIPDSYISNFGEEVVRGQSLFNLSLLTQKIQPMLRATAGVGSWQIVSHQAMASGTLMLLPSLASIQGSVFKSSQVVLADVLGGTEDIPEGVTAVLSACTTDVLSHVAIRARNCGVLLASCFDTAEFSSLKQLEGKNVVVVVDGSGQMLVTQELTNDASCTAQESMNVQLISATPSTPKVPNKIRTGEWVLTEKEFKNGKVGAKSANLFRLRKLLGDAKIQLPPSIALPIGVFEEVMADSVNASIASTLNYSLKRLEDANKHSRGRLPTELEFVRGLVGNEVMAPIPLQEALASAAEATGLIEDGAWKSKQLWDAAWRSICHVWASKWTHRAWLSRRARGMADNVLYMGCLLQKVVPAEYAFVVHTAHPISKDPNIMFCEIVAGLGEVLVGNYRGRALSYSITKDSNSRTQILSMPSKAVCLYAPNNSLIARSDSNGEDLETFAGAGLYESILTDPPKEVMVDYSKERLLWDSDFREELMQGVAKVGMEVEAAFHGQPQVNSCFNRKYEGINVRHLDDNITISGLFLTLDEADLEAKVSKAMSEARRISEQNEVRHRTSLNLFPVGDMGEDFKDDLKGLHTPWN